MVYRIDSMSPCPLSSASKFEPASITVHRINVGYGLERATVGIKVRNNRNVDATVRWLEEWPWWMKVYLHTMYVRIDGEQVPEGTRHEPLRNFSSSDLPGFFWRPKISRLTLA